LPSACAVGPDLAASPAQRSLVLVELNGGNDGLNTVIPYADETYAKLRPRMGIDRNDVRRLNESIGLHPGLAPLMTAWDKREFAVVTGVGYDDPNRSHFRSIDIWDTASDGRELLADGWIARALSDDSMRARRSAEGIVFGRPSVGPLVGSNARAIVMESPQNFANQARRVVAPNGRVPNPALAHVVRTQSDVRAAGEALTDTMGRNKVTMLTEFPKTGIGGQFSNAARLIAMNADAPVIKLSQGGYDNHTFQRATHDRLMAELGEALSAFRAAMIEQGKWDRVMVMTYSEFGRRPRENSAQGTDHGTAAPLFVMGGRVKGGLYGRQPSLDDLAEGDLKHHVDFRSVYATVLRRWWNLDATATLGRRFSEVGFVA
jgi:uncharacterized protein (DUF1501 family)